MITHFLADGSAVEDIEGHYVSPKDVPEFYQIIKKVKESEEVE